MRDINNYTRSYAKGKSFEFTEWSKLNNYTNSGIKQDFVTYGGSLYACICDVAAGNESPDKDTIHWKLAVAGSFTEREDLIKLLGFEPINPNTTNNFTKSQTFNAGINLNNTRIRKVKNPENGDDAANKQYVDTQITEVGEGMAAMQDAFNSAYEALGTEINSLTEKTTALETKASKIESDVVKYSGLYFYNLFGSKTSSEIKSSLYYPGYYPEDEEIDDLTYYTGLISYLRHTFNTKHLNTVQFYAVEDMTEEQYKYYGYFSDKETPEIILYNTGGKSYDFVKITCLESTDDEGYPNGYILDSVSTFSFPMEVIKNKVTSLEAKNTELVNTITELEPRVANAVSITYAELKSLRDAGKLVPGTQYRITDYATIVNSSFNSLELPFDIVVTALSSTRLSSSASALYRETADDSLENFDLSSWKLKYSLDNDTDKFNWASEDGKGVIYGMVDEFNNSAPFDFYSIYPEGKPLFPYPFTGSSYNNTIKEDRGADGQMLLPTVYFEKDVSNIEVSKNSEGEFVAYNVADLFASELPDNPSPDNPSPYSIIGTIGTIYYIGEI